MAVRQEAVSTGIRCPTRAPGFVHGCGPGAGRWRIPAMEAAAPAPRRRSSPARAPSLHQGVWGALCLPAAEALPVGKQRGPGNFGEECRGPMLAHPTHSRTEEWTHIGVEAGNAGTDSIVAPSRDMGGAVSAFLEEHPSALPAQAGIRAPHPLPRLSGTPTPLQSGGELPYPTQTGSGPHLALPPSFRVSFPRGLSSSSCTR